MNKVELWIRFVLTLVFGGLGIYILWTIDPGILVGVLLVMWADNISRLGRR